MGPSTLGKDPDLVRLEQEVSDLTGCPTEIGAAQHYLPLRFPGRVRRAPAPAAQRLSEQGARRGPLVKRRKVADGRQALFGGCGTPCLKRVGAFLVCPGTPG